MPEKMKDKIYTYSELMTLDTYGDRLEYLKEAAKGSVSPRSISNTFYKSKLWIETADKIKKRDLCQDLGVNGMYIEGVIGIHHINPLTEEDIQTLSYKCIDPENLISTDLSSTHNFIHYQEEIDFVEREKGDTIPWR